MKKRFITLIILLSFASVFSLFAQDNNTDEEFILYLSPTVKKEVSDDKTAIIIESDLQKAEVYLNGVYQGKTKLTVKNLVTGDYFVQIKKDDFLSPRYFISVKKGYVLTYKICQNESENILK